MECERHVLREWFGREVHYHLACPFFVQRDGHMVHPGIEHGGTLTGDEVGVSVVILPFTIRPRHFRIVYRVVAVGKVEWGQAASQCGCVALRVHDVGGIYQFTFVPSECGEVIFTAANP